MDYRAALNKAPGSAPTEPSQGSPKPQPKKSPKNPPKEKPVEQSHAQVNGSDDTVDHSKVIAPVVRFELYVPQVEKDGDDADEDEEVLKAEAEEGDDVVATPGDASDTQKEKAAPKASAADSASRYFPVQVIAGRRIRAGELASFLVKKIDDKAVELQGGFRFFEKVNQKNSSNFTVKPIPELNLDSVSQALRWVQAVIDILNNKVPPPIACGHNSFIHLNRVGESLKVSRVYGDEGHRRTEFVFKLEDFALRVREQAKSYVNAAQAVEDVIARRDRGDKTKTNKAAEKLNRVGFYSASKELKKLFGTTTALPKLSQKFQKQQQKKTQSKKQLQSEYKAMKALVLELVPKSFLERDIATLVPKEEEEPEVPEVKEEKPAPVAAAAAATQQQQQGAKKTGGDKKGQQQQQQTQQTAANQNKQQEKPAEKKDEPKKPRFEKEKENRTLKFTSNPYDIGEWDVNPDKGNDASAVVPPKPAASQGKQANKGEDKKQQQQPAKQQQAAQAAPKKAEKKPEQQQPKKEQPKPKEQPKQKDQSKKPKAAEKAVAKQQEEGSSNMLLFMGLPALGVLFYVFYMYFLPQLQKASV